MTLPKGYGAGGHIPEPEIPPNVKKKIKKSDGKELKQYQCDFCKKIKTKMYLILVKKADSNIFTSYKKRFMCLDCMVAHKLNFTFEIEMWR